MSEHISTLEERLQSHPRLKKNMEALLALVEETSSGQTTADMVEVRVIEALRDLGHDLLQTWAVTQERIQVEEFRAQHAATAGHGKKNCIGTPPLES